MLLTMVDLFALLYVILCIKFPRLVYDANGRRRQNAWRVIESIVLWWKHLKHFVGTHNVIEVYVNHKWVLGCEYKSFFTLCVNLIEVEANMETMTYM